MNRALSMTDGRVGKTAEDCQKEIRARTTGASGAVPPREEAECD